MLRTAHRNRDCDGGGDGCARRGEPVESERAERCGVGADGRPAADSEQGPADRSCCREQPEAGIGVGERCGGEEGEDRGGEAASGAERSGSRPSVDVDEGGRRHPSRVQRSRNGDQGAKRPAQRWRGRPLRDDEARGGSREAGRGEPEPRERPRPKGGTPQGLGAVCAQPRGSRGGCGSRRLAVDGEREDAGGFSEVDDAPDGKGEACRIEERRPGRPDQHVCV
mmetsp:Transcript_7020/g.20430  ORF Transcript_7020/g.20430 Transcript_7020/m.20430 type:complete len:224 (-) Transcript_7020:319-990(-)